MPKYPVDNKGNYLFEAPACHQKTRDQWTDADWAAHHTWVADVAGAGWEQDWEPIVAKFIEATGFTRTEAFAWLAFQKQHQTTGVAERMAAMFEHYLDLMHAQAERQKKLDVIVEEHRAILKKIEKDRNDDDGWKDPE